MQLFNKGATYSGEQSMPYELGYQAYSDGLNYSSNPYGQTSFSAIEWQQGWNDAAEFYDFGEYDFPVLSEEADEYYR